MSYKNPDNYDAMWYLMVALFAFFGGFIVGRI